MNVTKSEIKLPRFMIAAPGSGSGKTVITCGILKLLKGFKTPVAMKCGPDYIDPMFHQAVLGIPSRNLDTFFTPPDTTRYLLGRAAGEAQADMAVIEGVMGYYDGLGGISTKASSYDLSVQTQTPVILVVNAKGRSLSVLAEIKGFLDFYPDQQIRGVILNRVSAMTFAVLKPLIEERLHLAAIGYVPETETMTFPSRHLGLMMPGEIGHLQAQLTDFARLLEKTLDVPQLLAIAETAPVLAWQYEERVSDRADDRIRIGIAKDAAFCFYYEDNLAMLRQLGVEWVPFSPMADTSLPPDVCGLYMGGGYPELHAQILSENEAMHQAIRAAIADGMPCLAECGAFMYLHEQMEDQDGQLWPMAGVIEGQAVKKDRLVRFGYTTLTAQTKTILGDAGITLPAHEFHYWDTTQNGGCFTAQKPVSGRSWACMYQKNQLLAGFPHFCFYGNPKAAQNYVLACSAYKIKKS